LSESNSSSSNNNNNNNNNIDQQQPQQQQLIQEIQEEKEEQLSYILDASKASKQRLEYLAKKNEYNVQFDDGSVRTIKRKPLSAKKNKEIEDLRAAFSSSRKYENEFEEKGKKIKVNEQEFNNRSDILFEAYKKTAMYCLGLTEQEYDSLIWEDIEELEEKDIFGIKSIVEACLMRTVHGIAYFHQPSKTS
jgi:hypothetical protein